MKGSNSLFQTGYQSDAQIRLADDPDLIFHVHTAILGSRCEWFRNRFAESSQVRLPDIRPSKWP